MEHRKHTGGTGPCQTQEVGRSASVVQADIRGARPRTTRSSRAIACSACRSSGTNRSAVLPQRVGARTAQGESIQHLQNQILLSNSVSMSCAFLHEQPLAAKQINRVSCEFCRNSQPRTSPSSHRAPWMRRPAPRPEPDAHPGSRAKRSTPSFAGTLNIYRPIPCAETLNSCPARCL